MTVSKDPEGAEIAALREIVDLSDRQVLEIGCGDGRLTWRYADAASQITAIDPDAESIAAAKEQCPHRLSGKIDFQASSLQDFAQRPIDGRFDLAILSWSL